MTIDFQFYFFFLVFEMEDSVEQNVNRPAVRARGRGSPRVMNPPRGVRRPGSPIIRGQQSPIRGSNGNHRGGNGNIPRGIPRGRPPLRRGNSVQRVKRDLPSQRESPMSPSKGPPIIRKSVTASSSIRRPAPNRPIKKKDENILVDEKTKPIIKKETIDLTFISNDESPQRSRAVESALRREAIGQEIHEDKREKTEKLIKRFTFSELESMGEEKKDATIKKRNHIFLEIVSTEQSFVKCLRAVVNHYIIPFRNMQGSKAILSQDEITISL